MKTTFNSLIILILLFSACADKALHITPKLKQNTVKSVDEKMVEHRIYLIGDAGKADDSNNEYNSVVTAVQQKMQNENNHSVIFLGDNIYPEGLPKKEDEERIIAEQSLNAQLKPLEAFKDDVYFVPGNHDWRAGLAGVKRQAKYVKKFLDHKNAYLPKNGCSGPEVVDLSDNTVLIAIDSEWWLQNWNNEPKINEDCATHNRQEFINLYISALKKNRNKTVIVAMHHPLFTNGKHGGQFSLKNYFYPIPIFQTLFTALRKNGGVKQDNLYPAFKDFKNQILLNTANFDNVIFASGHEHSLQYFENQHPFIISGSGSKETAFKLGGGALFGVGKRGYAVVDVLKNGDAHVSFYKVNVEDASVKLIFSKQMIEAKADFIQTEFDDEIIQQDSIVTRIYEGKKPGLGKKLLWGALYTDMYYQDIKVPVLNLNDVHGGIKPIKKGGGNQTNSIRLENNEGKQYVLRAVIKDASRLSGGAFKGTFIVDMMNTIFTYSNPYAAYTIPPIASAAGVLHTNPKLVYLPKQGALGKFNESFGDQLYLFEERVEDNHSSLASFDNPSKIVSTPDMLEKTQKEHDHRINQNHFLRSRLFDLLIGDWDRHEDQWRWVVTKEDGYTYYKAIPRDRDQPYTRLTGSVKTLLGNTIPDLRQINTFKGNISSSRWLGWSGRNIDRYSLSELTWQDWEAEITHLKNNLNEEIFRSGISAMPKPAFDQKGDFLIQGLVERLSNLEKYAKKYYKEVNKIIAVRGTKKKDLFTVERLPNGNVKVSVHKYKNEEKSKLHFERTFVKGETKEIVLYGMDGKDYFNLSGRANGSILVRIVGGLKNDHVINNADGTPSLTKVYDNPDGVKLEGNNVTSRLKNDYYTNSYQYKDRDLNYLIPIIYAAFDPDNGPTLGTFLSWTSFGFKKRPFKQNHTIGGIYAFGTDGSSFNYKGQFTEVIGKFDFVMNAKWNGSRFTQNYFGIGNNSTYDIDQTLNFNRVRTQTINVNPQLRKTWDAAEFAIGPFYEQNEVEQTADRFVNSAEALLPERVFGIQRHAGLMATYTYSNSDTLSMPTQGMVFNLNVDTHFGISKNAPDHSGLETNLVFYSKLTNDGKIVMANKVAFATRFGNDFDFYHGSSIGGTASLRGFRNERFIGKTAFYNMNDIRIKLGKIRTSFLPFTVGITGSFDNGKVWNPNIESDQWHVSYGGALWFNTIGLATISFGYHTTQDEKGRLVFGIGYGF